MAKNDSSIWGPPPPGYDFGHAVMPSDVQNQGVMFGALANIGDQLRGIDMTREGSIKFGRPEIIDHNSVLQSLQDAAYRMQARVDAPTSYDRKMFKEMGEYTYDEYGRMYHNGKMISGVQVTSNNFNNQPLPPTYQYQQNSHNINNTMASLNDYINGGNGGAVPQRPASAPMAQTTVTFVDLQNANKPIVDKLEITCQLLGKLIGVQLDTQRMIAAMPENVAVQIQNVQYGMVEPDEAILDEVQNEVDQQDFVEQNADSYITQEVAEPEVPREVEAKPKRKKVKVNK